MVGRRILGSIIPDSAHLLCTIRSYSSAVRAKLLAGIRRVANASVAMADAPAPVLEPSIKTATKAMSLAVLGALAR